MKIVIPDAFAVNPGDLSWEFLDKYGEADIYQKTKASEVVSRCRGAEAVFSNRTPITEELLISCPTIRFVNALGTGYDMIDIEACRRRGVTVCNIPAYSSDSVAQLAFSFILNLTNDINGMNKAVYEGDWTSKPGSLYKSIRLTELAGLTLGLIGCGGIGRRVAEIARAFKMNVVATTRSRTSGEEGGITYLPLDRLLMNSDIVSIHCPLTSETRGMVDKAFISKMKDSAILINTARGAILNENDVADALNSGKLAAAGLDVLAKEPPLPENPLLKAKNCVITPHIGWATRAARARLLNILEENLSDFINGRELKNRIV